MARVIGANVHRNRLRRMRSKYMQDAVIRAIYDAGEKVRADAQASIRAGAIMGPGHIPSNPGEPPNADTGNLDMSIDVRMSANRKSVTVTAMAEYAAALEFGTSRIIERPFLRPALQRNKNRLVYGVAQAVRDQVRVYKNSTRSIDEARRRVAEGLA